MENLKVKVKDCRNGKGVFAKKTIVAEEVITCFTGKMCGRNGKYNLQVMDDRYITASKGIDDYINHSCEANSYINFSDYKLRAIRTINEEEEITWNYNTSEYDLGKYSFECHCGSKNCAKKVGGFKYLPLNEKLKLEPYLSPFIRIQLYLLNKT